VSFMLENVALLWKGPAPIAYPDVFPSFDILREWFGMDSAIFVTSKDLLVVAATLPLMLALHYFVTRTRWGKAMRATAQDRETAQATASPGRDERWGVWGARSGPPMFDRQPTST